jgi:hypothetical protein
MTLETLLKTELWQHFQQQARAARRKPADMLAELLREYLETANDVALNEAMRRDAQNGGYTQADAVRLVRRHRASKKEGRATS